MRRLLTVDGDGCERIVALDGDPVGANGGVRSLVEGAVQVRLLGPVDVTVGGVARSVSGLRRKAVLAVLSLHEGEIVSTDRFIDILWNDRAPATARNTLQSHVSYLRKVFGVREAIVARPPGYALQLGSAATDVATAQRLIQQARQSADQHRTASQLQAALDLWRGPALSDVTGIWWLEAQAERLAQLRREGIHALIEARLAMGEHLALVPELQRLIAQQPHDEQLHRQLMIVLYRAGRQADALATYQRLRGRLAEDLGVAPTPALRGLETAILRHDPSLDPQPQAVTLAAPAPDRAVPAQLPLATRTFVSRAAELAHLDAILEGMAKAGPAQPPAVVISAVSGTAGIGKTALAVHWAHRVAAEFPDGQLYVNLRGFDPAGSALDPTVAVRSFLDAFGIPAHQIPAELDAQASLYRSTLAGKRVLVVLDNARDVEQVRPLLPGSPGCLVLITSRNQLTPLVATEGAHPFTLDLLSPAHARDLLAGRLGVDRVRAEPQAVDDIIARCAGLPLALAVAAARAATQHNFSLATLAAQLRDTAGRLDAFRGGDTATDIRAVFSWSYRTLSPDAARLFRLLGLHSGPDISSPAVASLAGIPIEQARRLLAELIDAHLLTEHHPGRHTFHDLLRAYAAEQARDVDDEHTRRAAHNRILDHYLYSAHTASALLGPALAPLIGPPPLPPDITAEVPADDDAALAWFTAERAVVLAAIEHAAEAGFHSHAWQLAWTLTTFLLRQGFWHDQGCAQSTALSAARRAGDLTGQAHALLGLGLGYARSGQGDRAFTWLQEAVDKFAAVGDPVGQAGALEVLAWLAERQDRFADALATIQRALDLVHATEHRSETARLLNGVGWCHALLGEHRLAIAYCEEALAIAQELNDRNTEAATWDSLAYAHHHLGNYRQAVTCYHRSIDLYRSLADCYNEATTLAALGDSHHDVGQFPAARQAWQTAAQILDRLDHPDADQIHAKLGTRAQ